MKSMGFQTREALVETLKYILKQSHTVEELLQLLQEKNKHIIHNPVEKLLLSVEKKDSDLELLLKEFSTQWKYEAYDAFVFTGCLITMLIKIYEINIHEYSSSTQKAISDSQI